MAVTGSDVAIVGMSCVFPGAAGIDAFWQNIVEGRDAVTDPPVGAKDILCDPDPVYCWKGGYLGELASFDPLEHRIPPLSIAGGDADQWLALRVAHEALVDAGYASAEVPERHRTAVVLGKGNYLMRGNLSLLQHGAVLDQTIDVLRTLHPEYDAEELARVRAELARTLPSFDADTVGGMIPNIAASRIANRLDLMGPTYTIDAACASSLIAADLAVKDLNGGRCDLALVGGLHIVSNGLIRRVFSELGALSRQQRIRPFDRSADGTVLGEGVGMVVLKRAEDARRAGNRIYALIKGIGVSSDGHGSSVLAPRLEGEVLAIQRAYEAAGVDPATVDLIEAHGTATPVGDATELQALDRVFGGGASRRPIAVGSVKSMIGHLLPAAGIAALIKTALAVYHRTLPPSLGVEEPSEALPTNGPLYVNGSTRPWLRASAEPRRAGINAFGFGGINAHVVLEEDALADEAALPTRLRDWDHEVFVLAAASTRELRERIQALVSLTEAFPAAALRDLAYTTNVPLPAGTRRLGVVASSIPDLVQKLALASERLAADASPLIRDARGIYHFPEPLGGAGRVAFLFPGEGSQYPGMLADLFPHFPEARKPFDLTERAAEQRGMTRPSDCLFPISRAGASDGARVEADMWAMQGAVASVLAADGAAYEVLRAIRISADAMVGHSTGEYAALAAAGMIDVRESSDGVRFALDLADVYDRTLDGPALPRVTLLAAAAGASRLRDLLAPFAEAVHFAMVNCPHQTVLCGTPEVMERVDALLRTKGVLTEKLKFDRPYHTSLFTPVSEPLRELFGRWLRGSPGVALYSCATASRFQPDLEAVRSAAVDHWTSTVRFQETVEAMYGEGIRVFVEVGARGNLSAFVADTLRDRPHLAVAANLPTRSGVAQLQHLVAALAAHGVEMDLARLYSRRSPVVVGGDAAAPRPLRAPVRLVSGWPTASVSARPAGRTANDRETSGAAATGETSADQAMGMHFQTMERFLSVQREVMEAFLEGRGAPPARSTTPDVPEPPLAPLPFLGVVEKRSAHEVVLRRALSVDEDLFLRHHTFGRRVSALDPELLGVPVMPLTMSIEVMAEAASLLAPGRVLVALRDLRVYRWIAADAGSPSLRVAARLRASRAEAIEVDVQIHVVPDAAAPEPSHASPVVEGTIVFSTDYAAPPAPAPMATADERPSRWRPEDIYEEVLFHEAAFRGVERIVGVSDNGCRAMVRILDPRGLFQSNDSPRFLIDPVFLDQLGQVAGLWAYEKIDTLCFFPFRVARIDLFRPPLEVGALVECRAHTSMPDGERLTADIEVLDGDGSLAMRVVGWEDRGFPTSSRITRFTLDPRASELSDAWSSESQAPEAGRVSRRLSADDFPLGFFQVGGAMWLRSLAHGTLSRSERDLWRSLASLPSEERVDWLVRRLAIKDATRAYLRDAHGLVLAPADVEVHDRADGSTVLAGSWTTKLAAPSLQTLRNDREFVAIAEQNESGVIR